MKKEILSNPEFIKNYPLLQEMGVIGYINSLNREIQNYKNLVNGALDIFDSTTINDILEAAVRQILDRLLPSYTVFLWKPLLNREDITIKCYKNHKPVDFMLRVNSIRLYEPLFRKLPHPLKYAYFSSGLLKNKIHNPFDAIQPALVMPILGPSGLYGMVLLGPKILEDDYSQVELLHLKELMSFVSRAIQNYLHYEMTLRDEKTGLYNKGFFLNRLAEEISRIKRNGNTASVIMMDVDNFRKINDSYGHLAGDRVLESLAIAIKQGVRTEDTPSRFGGGMFAVLLPGMDKGQAWIAAERIRKIAAGMKVQWEPPLPQITISLGICPFTKSGNTGLSAEKIFRSAEEALHISKGLGRNRTTVWGSGLFDKIQRLETSTKEKRN